MVQCCVPQCYNASYRKTPEITFHRFPKDEYQRDLWIKNINRKDWQPKSSSVICSKHFTNNVIKRNAFRTILATGAMPTIFKEKLAENKENEFLLPEAVFPRTSTIPSMAAPLMFQRCSNFTPPDVSFISSDFRCPNN